MESPTKLPVHGALSPKVSKALSLDNLVVVYVGRKELNLRCTATPGVSRRFALETAGPM